MIYINYDNLFNNKSKFQNLTDFTIDVNGAKMGTEFPNNIINSLNNLQNFNMGGSNNHSIANISINYLFNRAIVNGNLKNFNCYNGNLSFFNRETSYYGFNFGWENNNNSAVRKSCINGIFDNLVGHTNQNVGSGANIFFSNVSLKNSNLFFNGDTVCPKIGYFYDNADGIFRFDSLINLNINNLNFNGVFYGMKEINSIDLFNLNGTIKNFDMSFLDAKYINNRWINHAPNRSNLKNFKINPNLIVYNGIIGGFNSPCINLEEVILPNNILGNLFISSPFWQNSNLQTIQGLQNVPFPISLNYFLYNCKNLNNFKFSNNFNLNNTKYLINMLQNCDGFNDFESLEKSSFESAIKMLGAFSYGNQLTTINTSNWKLNNVEDMSFLFAGCNNLTDIYGTEKGTFNKDTINFSYFCYNCANLRNINNLSGDLGNCNNLFLISSFLYCPLLSSFNLILNNVNLNNVCMSGLIGGVNFNLLDLSNITGQINNFFFRPVASGYSSIDTIKLNSNLKVNSLYLSFFNCNNLGNLYLPNNINNILYLNDNVFLDCNKLRDINGLLSVNRIMVIPAKNNASNNYQNLGYSGFYGCSNLTNLSPNQEGTFQKNVSLINFFGNCKKLTNFINTNGYFSGDIRLGSTFNGCDNLVQLPSFKGDFNIKNLGNTFSYCSNLQNLNGLQNLKFSDGAVLNNTFANCYNLQDLNGIQNGTFGKANLEYLFYGCNNLTDISALQTGNTSNIISMNNLFAYCNNLTDVSALQSWNVSNVKSITFLFSQLKNLINLSFIQNGNVSNVVNISGLFVGCSNLTDISALQTGNTSNIAELSKLFSGCSNLTNISPIQNWHFSKSNFINIESLFVGCSNLIDFSPIQNGKLSNIINMQNIFASSGIISLNGIINTGTLTDKIDPSCLGSFCYNCKNLQNVNITNGNISGNNYTLKNGFSAYVSDCFTNCTNLTEVNLYNGNVKGLKSFYNLFSNCFNLINVDMSNGKSETIWTFSNVFNNCLNINFINLANWDVNNLTNMNSCFNNCRNLQEINFNGGKFNKISLDRCFENCRNLSNSTCFNIANLLLNINSYTGTKNLNTSFTSSPFYQGVNLQNILDTDIINQLENQGGTF